MATRKLSDAQRAEIRRIIKKDLANGIPEAEILNAMAAKYSISYATARWYLRAVTSRNGSLRTSLRKQQSKKISGKGGPKATVESKRLLEVAGKYSREELRWAIAAQAILPRLKVTRTELATLEKEKARIDKAVGRATATASELERKLKRLGTKGV